MPRSSPQPTEIDGLKELRRDLRRLQPSVDKELRSEIKEVAGKVAAEASLLAPRRTGKLASSYKAFARGNTAGVRSSLLYAAVHEYGGIISPRGVDILIQRSGPVTRAIERQTDSIVAHMVDAVERAAKRTGWR